jgi:hypothetical protein
MGAEPAMKEQDMSSISSAEVPPAPPAGPLGVVGAMGMGWRLLKSDFWRLWLLALALNLILVAGVMVGQCLGVVPIIGACFSSIVSMAIGIFVQPALMAGLFFAIRQKIDGAGVRLDNLFAAFRWRYWESVVGGLPALVIGFGVGLVMLLMAGAGYLVVMGISDGDPERLFRNWDDPTPYILIGVGVLALLLLVLVAALLQLFLIFVFLAVWDFPGKFWAPIATSLRLVLGHFWSVLGLVVLFGLIGMGAFLVAAVPGGALAGAGALAQADWSQPPVQFLVLLGIGFLLFLAAELLLMCGLSVWCHSALIYLYRFWRGQPLVQPVTFPWQAAPPPPE